MKAFSKHIARRNGGAFLGAAALMALAGCGGGGGGNNGNSTSNAGLAPVNLTALTNDNRLVTFNARTPRTSTLVTISGLTSGDSLRGIDNRFTSVPTTPPADGNTGLYSIGQNGTTQQLYRLAVTGNTATATAIGARFSLTPAAPAAAAFGFDFNPTVDRIRVIEPTANRDIRLNPNTGAQVDGDADTTNGVQPDGVITYDASDVNAGKDPDAVGAAYTNPDADIATGTALYVLDSKNDTLSIQGRVDDPATPANEAVGPNLGRLFTVGNLGINLQTDSGFDISPSGNAAFLSNGNQIYGLNLATGGISGGDIVTGLGVRIIGIAVTS